MQVLVSAPFEFKPFGDSAILISSDRSLVGYQEALARFGFIRIGMTSLLIDGIDPKRIDEVRSWLADTDPALGPTSSKSHTLKVTYDGPDLGSVSERLGISSEELVATHSGVEWKVAMVGFAPGFAYLTTDEVRIFDSIPRLASPRAKVPAGSLAIAAGMSAIYPSASPGGWQLIGTSGETLFDSSSSTPARLAAGDVVRFQR